MASNFTEWEFQLINGRTGAPIDDDSAVYNVLTAGDPAELTLYSDDNATSLSNPTTMTDGKFRFFTADTVTSCDISVLTADGFAIFLDAVTPSQHRIVVWPEEKDFQTLIIPYTYSGASETVVDTGFDVPAKVVVKDAFVKVTTAGSTALILEVGTSLTVSGFLAAVHCSTTGFKMLGTSGGELLSSVSTNKIGIFLASATSQLERKMFWRPNATSGAQIVYANVTSDTDAGAGYIYLTMLRTPAP
jgi:hypothetical protein